MNFTVTLDEYELVNLLYALETHPCLNSGDWYLQVRAELTAMRSNLGLNQAPNPLYCQRNGGHGAPALASASAIVASEKDLLDETPPTIRTALARTAMRGSCERTHVIPEGQVCEEHPVPTGQWAEFGLDDGDDADPWA